jgi:cephalosporin-C deacetylase
MKYKVSFLLAALAFTGLLFSCNPSGNVAPEDLEPLKGKVPVTNNWVFDSRPDITVHVENPNDVKADAVVKLRIVTDQKKNVVTLEKSTKVDKNGSADVSFTTDEDLAPGFYKASCYVNDILYRNFTFGVSPLEIVSAPDKQDDFDQFWSEAINQLPELNGSTVNMVEIPSKSNDNCTVYFVEFQSVPDNPDPSPVIVRGYYLEPKNGKKPVIMHFQGYDTLNKPPKIYSPSGNSGEFAEFYLSHRGQYINHRTADKRDDGIDQDFVNIYGDWFAYNFGKKDGYYYRGAFMDCIQAVHFMATRDACDMSNLFAEGSSQGGALSYAAAALSDIPFTAIAPNVAFLGDFPDYFKIVDWPANVAKENKGSMTDEEMYAFLSYFDTKNLATRISCPVYATIGLQDTTCPPHTNIAPYNNLLSTDKQLYFYPEMTHSYPTNWYNDVVKFFKAHIK